MKTVLDNYSNHASSISHLNRDIGHMTIYTWCEKEELLLKDFTSLSSLRLIAPTQSFIDRFPYKEHIKKLGISAPKNMHNLAFLAAYKNLEELALIYRGHSHNILNIDGLEALGQLKHLYIEFNLQTTFDSLEAILGKIQNPEVLERLTLKTLQLKEKCLVKLGTFKNLRFIDIDFNDFPKASWLELFETFPHLNQCFQHVDVFGEELLQLVDFPIKDFIKKLRIRNPENIKDMDILQHFPYVQALELDISSKNISLDGLKHLTHLEHVTLKCFTKMVDFKELTSAFDRPEKIKTLHLEHFTKLSNLESIEVFTNLEVFIFEGVSIGSIGKLIKLDSLKPLSHLKKLTTLKLHSIRTLDNEIMPLKNLFALEVLSLSTNMFRQEQFARLSAYFPDIESNCLKPYNDWHHFSSQGEKIEQYSVVGSRKKVLYKGKDEALLQKEITKFNAFKNDELDNGEKNVYHQ